MKMGGSSSRLGANAKGVGKPKRTATHPRMCILSKSRRRDGHQRWKQLHLEMVMGLWRGRRGAFAGMVKCIIIIMETQKAFNVVIGLCGK